MGSSPTVGALPFALPCRDAHDFMPLERLVMPRTALLGRNASMLAKLVRAPAQTALTCAPGAHMAKRQSSWPGRQEASARLAQSAERKALNLVVVGSSPTVGAHVLAHWPRARNVDGRTARAAMAQAKAVAAEGDASSCVAEMPAARRNAWQAWKRAGARTEPPVGFEPTTSRLLSGCSTN